MAELATIARPYAEALFKATSSDLAGTSAWLERVAAIYEVPILPLEELREYTLIHGEEYVEHG